MLGMEIEAKMYVVRRCDTGEYFKKISPSWLKNWPANDPRRNNWTPDIEKAKTYTLKGAVSLAATYSKHRDHLEVVKLKITVDCVVKSFELLNLSMGQRNHESAD